MRKKIVWAVLACVFVCATCLGEVADSNANGFTVKITSSIHAAPRDVYNKLIHSVGDWWSSKHTFSGDAHNLSIEERPMGCFCEKLPNGGGVRHMEVVFFAPGKTLRMAGAMGPLQGMGTFAVLTFTLTPEDRGTKVEIVYALTGYSPQGMSSWAATLDGVLTEQVTRLKNYIETGNPVSK